jgi:RNA polymerase sigma-70 factor (ECF subfamily)
MDISLKLQQSEEDYIHACIRGEQWAQRKIYEDNFAYMLPVCLRYATDESEAMDILHEGFIKVYRHISKYTPGTSLTAWIRRIMVNAAIDYYRKQSKRRTTDLDTVYDMTDNEPDIISQISADEILKAMQKLTPSYRTVFNLYVVEGYSHREIAKELGITESTSRSNLVKARGKLRAAIQVMYKN